MVHSFARVSCRQCGALLDCVHADVVPEAPPCQVCVLRAELEAARGLLRKYMAHVLRQEGRLYLDDYLVCEELDYETDPPTVDRAATFTDAELATLREIGETIRAEARGETAAESFRLANGSTIVAHKDGTGGYAGDQPPPSGGAPRPTEKG